jgi:hypothetical protein
MKVNVMSKNIQNNLFRVSQEERSIFWEVIISSILRKEVYMNLCPIPNGFRYLARSILHLETVF